MAICVDRGAEAAVSNGGAGRPGTYRRPGWTRTRAAARRCKSLHHSTRAAATLAVLVVDLTPFWLERLGRFAKAQNRSVGTPSHRRDEASQDGDMLHAPCSSVVRIRVPREGTCVGAFPELELVPVQSTRQRQHLVSSTVLERTGATSSTSNCSIPQWKCPPWLPSLEGYLHRVRLSSRRTACGMGVPPPSSSLSSLSSCSLAAANDTRDAIALSRRASPRPSELGIALVFPALILHCTAWLKRRFHVAGARGSRLTTQDQGRRCGVHVHVDAHTDAHGSVFPGPRLVSSPLPVLASIHHPSFPRPTVAWRAQTDSDSQAAIAANAHAGRWRHRCEPASTGNLAAFGSAE
ncbi:uncharacterized protein TrAtP1_004286 [Trichoderma atroviride]|uniref:Uncharacterized protein n=1 Tax=Hypocrea atroviridis (strain ATCC 20476 / IMI 206040) TaxID=452589 RepID=G9P859_HYPAI|nr:uncharacterized protein TRIATDRAFT_311491 [Trichoderma atroviride IMI 206040]EHK40907.1 hypothetical protein TRIATDRAFT_311491 [Trichoderma atroviride IMI 206040]UKZ63058.1 hypothetical protein TrAtP1_004286 [Trichoderma atroviride]